MKRGGKLLKNFPIVSRNAFDVMRIGREFCALIVFSGCETDGDRDESQVRVANYSSGTVILRVDDADLGNVMPRGDVHYKVREGMHTVLLLREEGSLIFDQNIDIEKGQYVRYIVRSDESVLADGGGV